MARRPRPLTRAEVAWRICYGVVITSVWLSVNGVVWWGLDQFSRRVKLVEFDYGDDGGLTFDVDLNAFDAEGDYYVEWQEAFEEDLWS